jgi:hypothetical protein
MDGAIRGSSQEGWKANTMKTKLVRKAIKPQQDRTYETAGFWNFDHVGTSSSLSPLVSDS